MFGVISVERFHRMGDITTLNTKLTKAIYLSTKIQLMLNTRWLGRGRIVIGFGRLLSVIVIGLVLWQTCRQRFPNRIIVTHVEWGEREHIIKENQQESSRYLFTITIQRGVFSMSLLDSQEHQGYIATRLLNSLWIKVLEETIVDSEQQHTQYYRLCYCELHNAPLLHILGDHHRDINAKVLTYCKTYTMLYS